MKKIEDFTPNEFLELFKDIFNANQKAIKIPSKIASKFPCLENYNSGISGFLEETGRHLKALIILFEKFKELCHENQLYLQLSKKDWLSQVVLRYQELDK